MRNDVEKAIETGPNRKAVGPDNVKNEMLQVDTSLSTRLIMAIWEACGRIATIPDEWMRSTLIPIHKKGPTHLPDNYRPISLLSHIRKVLETALDKITRREYEFRSAQLGFQKEKGTELAIVRAMEHFRKGQKCVAVLDLKGAYDLMPRQDLVDRINIKLSPLTAKMLKMTLAPLRIQTKGDDHISWFQIDRGVAQGSPLSPTLYNIFMDTFVEEMDDIPTTIALNPCTLFAGDVKISATHPEGLQLILDKATKWAEQRRMTWSTSKCEVLIAEQTTDKAFFLSGKELRKEKEVEYLGISLTQEGISDSKLIQRIEKAKPVLYIMKRLGVFRLGSPPEKGIRLYKTLVQSRWEYGLHLTPWNEQISNAVASVESQFFGQILGKIGRSNIHRIRSMCRIQSPEDRRSLLAQCMTKRIKGKIARLREAPQSNRNKRELTEAENDLEAMRHLDG